MGHVKMQCSRRRKGALAQIYRGAFYHIGFLQFSGVSEHVTIMKCQTHTRRSSRRCAAGAGKLLGSFAAPKLSVLPHNRDNSGS